MGGKGERAGSAIHICKLHEERGIVWLFGFLFMPPEQVNAPAPVQPDTAPVVPLWERKGVWIPLAVAILLGGGVYFISQNAPSETAPAAQEPTAEAELWVVTTTFNSVFLMYRSGFPPLSTPETLVSEGRYAKVVPIRMQMPVGLIILDSQVSSTDENIFFVTARDPRGFESAYVLNIQQKTIYKEPSSASTAVSLVYDAISGEMRIVESGATAEMSLMELRASSKIEKEWTAVGSQTELADGKKIIFVLSTAYGVSEVFLYDKDSSNLSSLFSSNELPADLKHLSVEDVSPDNTVAAFDLYQCSRCDSFNEVGDILYLYSIESRKSKVLDSITNFKFIRDHTYQYNEALPHKPCDSIYCPPDAGALHTETFSNDGDNMPVRP